MLLVLALILSLGAAHAARGADTLHMELEVIYDQGRFEEGVRKTKQAIDANPNDGDLYWHLARFYFEVGEKYLRTDGVIDKEELYEQMLAASEQGLLLQPGHPHHLFARGIANGRLGTTRGILSSLFLADDIESDWLKVQASGFEYSSLNGQEILPCDVYMSLGVFYRLVPDWWLVEAIAGTRGDLNKSVTLLGQANQCQQDRIEVVKELGCSQICLGQSNDDQNLIKTGMANLHKAAAMPPMKPTDRIDQEHLQLLIADPDKACLYSRDGQAELDRSALEN